jgi:hypothetical protein
MPPGTLEHIRTILGMSIEKSFHLNLGNDRRDIVPLIWQMKNKTHFRFV